jgi:DNA polymerase III delta prime subunit
MKYYESHYEEYIASMEKYNMHPELRDKISGFPPKVSQLENVIIYGPPGSGKYTQVLGIIKKYSASDLKYDKKITIQTEKQDYIYRISDIHFEIDISLLGCNSKLLWNELFLQIVDIISVKQEKIGIILCKNFHLIHTELLEIFYSYMQQFNNLHSHIKIKFFIITEHLSFIPSNIVNACHVLRLRRPEKQHYIQYIKNIDNDEKAVELVRSIDSSSILNIKELRSFPYISAKNNLPKEVFNTICDNIISEMTNTSQLVFTKFRDSLYDILTYNLDMIECLWYILSYFIENEALAKEDISDILIKTYSFLKYYNNNYRPIYHLESIIFYIINKLEGYDEKR